MSMNYEEQSVCKNVAKESEVFATIKRINSKLENLRSILNPIIVDRPQEKLEQSAPTALLNELRGIESKIEVLLDTIEL